MTDSPLTSGVELDDQLDAPYRSRVQRRHLRAVAALLLIPVGVVVLLLIPWSSGAEEVLWIGLFIAPTLVLAIPAAYRLWEGDADPEPLPPGPQQRS